MASDYDPIAQVTEEATDRAKDAAAANTGVLTEGMSQPSSNDYVDAGIDRALISEMGAEAGSGRRAVNYATYMALKAQNADLRLFAVMYEITGKTGRKRVALPAEKHQKWFGMGFSPIGYVFEEPPAPKRWSMSMVEQAIMDGEPIPLDMKPDGYAGPVFEIENEVVPQPA